MKSKLIKAIKSLVDPNFKKPGDMVELRYLTSPFFVNRFSDCKDTDEEFSIWREDQKEESDPSPLFSSNSPEKIADWLIEHSQEKDTDDVIFFNPLS